MTSAMSFHHPSAYSAPTENFCNFLEDEGSSVNEWWLDTKCEKNLENYLFQNFNIPPRSEKTADKEKKLPPMVPGTKNFADSEDVLKNMDLVGKTSISGFTEMVSTLSYFKICEEFF